MLEDIIPKSEDFVDGSARRNTSRLLLSVNISGSSYSSPSDTKLTESEVYIYPSNDAKTIILTYSFSIRSDSVIPATIYLYKNDKLHTTYTKTAAGGATVHTSNISLTFKDTDISRKHKYYLKVSNAQSIQLAPLYGGLTVNALELL